MASKKIDGIAACQWHNLKLRFEGNDIIGYVDGREVVSCINTQYPHGMAGLMAPMQQNRISTPYFDNLEIIPTGKTPSCTTRTLDIHPMYPAH